MNHSSRASKEARLFCFSSKTDRLFEIMRSKFPGYFRLSPSEYKKLWKQGIISMDANVLLDLYRYSQETRDELLKLLNNLKDRLWITNRAAFEFLEGRAGAICENITRYEDSIARLDDLEKVLKKRAAIRFWKNKQRRSSRTPSRSFVNICQVKRLSGKPEPSAPTKSKIQ